MTPAEAVAKVQHLLSGQFPPNYFHEPERVAAFLTADGSLGGLVEVLISSEDAHSLLDEAGVLRQYPAVVAVEVRTAAMPHQKYAYRFAVADLAAYEEHTLRATWLFALVRAVEREAGVQAAGDGGHMNEPVLMCRDWTQQQGDEVPAAVPVSYWCTGCGVLHSYAPDGEKQCILRAQPSFIFPDHYDGSVRAECQYTIGWYAAKWLAEHSL